MEIKRTFIFKSDLDSLSGICREVGGILAETALAPAAVYAISLSLEEMGTNIVKYGYDDTLPHDIELTLSVGPAKTTLALIDDGHEFNPLQAEVTSFSDDIAERQIGGMGIHLTKSMTEKMQYTRDGGKNILTITVNNQKS